MNLQLELHFPMIRLQGVLVPQPASTVSGGWGEADQVLGDDSAATVVPIDLGLIQRDVQRMMLFDGMGQRGGRRNTARAV